MLEDSNWKEFFFARCLKIPCIEVDAHFGTLLYIRTLDSTVRLALEAVIFLSLMSNSVSALTPIFWGAFLLAPILMSYNVQELFVSGSGEY